MEGSIFMYYTALNSYGSDKFLLDSRSSEGYDTAHSHKMRQTPIHRRFCPVRADLSMQTLRAHTGNFRIAEGYVCLFDEECEEEDFSRVHMMGW